MAEDAASIGTFDYVIVGAGTAGCVLANRLSADPGTSVLLLEAGGKDNWLWIHIPIGYLYTQNNPRTDWCFKTDPEPGLNGRALNYPRGRVLGGCSSINGMIYMRGQARDYDGWRQQGNRGWGWDDVLPYFKKSEDNALGADEMHGQGGEWRIEQQRLSWEILDAFRDAAAEVGIPKIADFNRGNNEGCAYFQVTQRRGVRWSTSKAFLRPAQDRPNLTVLTGAQASGIAFEGRRAVGLRFRQGSQDKLAIAGREVLLASGAIGSPQLLQLSGVGPGALLQELGIPVVHANESVGANLQDHLQIRTVYKVKNTRTLNEQANSLLGRARMGLEYALFRRGPLTMAPSQLGAFAKSDSCSRDARSRVSRPAAVAGEVRRPAAPVPGVHRLGLQPAAGEPGPGAHQEPRARRSTLDPAELPGDRIRPPGRGRGDPPDPADLFCARTRPVRACKNFCRVMRW